MEKAIQNANNLMSKNANLAARAAFDIVNNSDAASFKALESKSEFIFDFIKIKILNNLENAVSQHNVQNLFNLMKIYSYDFKDFIINSFVKFNCPEIEDKMFEILDTGEDSEKTYALEFFSKIKNEKVKNLAKRYIDSNFDPLKAAAIRLLFTYGEKEEYNRAKEILKNSNDDFEKLEAADFIFKYGDKEGFFAVYNYFINCCPQNEIVAQNLLNLKDFKALIFEENKEAVFAILATVLRAFPYMISFCDISCYLNEKLFNYLLESPDNFACILIFYLEYKLKLISDDENYCFDLTLNDKKSLSALLEEISPLSSAFDKQEAIKEALLSPEKSEVLLGLELLGGGCLENGLGLLDTVKALALKAKDSEIILLSLEFLKQINALDKTFIDVIANKTNNKNIKAQINSFV